MAKRDEHGRRLFKTEDKALAAQRLSIHDHGIWSAVMKDADGHYYLRFDWQAEQ